MHSLLAVKNSLHAKSGTTQPDLPQKIDAVPATRPELRCTALLDRRKPTQNYDARLPAMNRRSTCRAEEYSMHRLLESTQPL
ncbi:hypothetical protein NDU88_000825 [Pleurodeles waltl]|uniref:Uncharacterized protein n=1 Tax=Pleurodeles waltl TaxID=8319 RepID=A0AAV7VXQ4_PLEWA|nr:hypothetical protein NDU88_000825 [Pleurodeles waltl]